MAKSPDFDYIVRAYKDKYGIDLSHMKMKWSKHPVYNNGKRSYELDDDETGGSWCRDGAVRINPNMRPVMDRFGVGGTVKDFRRRLIAHELAHEVWHNQSDRESIKKLIRDSLRQARKEKFTTPYLDTYSPDTPKKKFDSELFAEWMSHQLNKKAESPEDIAADMHKRIRYGIRYSDGTYETSPKVWEKRDANDIVVQTPEELYEFNIGMCHDVTRALIKKLKEKRIKHVAMMLTGDRMPNLPTHSFVVYDRNGKHTVLDPFSYATGSKGEYSSVREAVKDRIEDWKKEEEKGNIHSYRIPKKDWENRGLLDFLHFNGEKKASAKKETYESGEGKVESYTHDKTEGHDEIVLRLNDGRRIRISNNTRLGKVLKARIGSRVGYHGWRIDGTNVVHKVHPNVHSRGGWLEEKAASAYEPPWTIDRIREEYGDEVADQLANDPVHKWRSDTGIELVHKEPTKEELSRIIENWRLMDALKKRRSNRKSKELFGMTNLQHAKELLK